MRRSAKLPMEADPKSKKKVGRARGLIGGKSFYRVFTPAAIPGITTGIILGMARAIEETAAILYTVGAALAIPMSIWDPARPLPLHLYILATEGVSLPNAYGTAAVLVLIILIITISTNYLVEKYTKKMMGR